MNGKERFIIFLMGMACKLFASEDAEYKNNANEQRQSAGQKDGAEKRPLIGAFEHISPPFRGLPICEGIPLSRMRPLQCRIPQAGYGLQGADPPGPPHRSGPICVKNC